MTLREKANAQQCKCLAFGSIVGKIFGLGLCKCSWLSASLFRYYATSILPSQMMHFRALPHSLGYIFSTYFSLIILNMHHEHDCNRVYLKVRRGLVVSTVLLSPTSLKYRVIKTLELCSSGKEKKKKKKKKA